MRGQVVKFREGFAVIDDTYNSNPKALSEMMCFIGRLQGWQRKITRCGEMLELGPRGDSSSTGMWPGRRQGWAGIAGGSSRRRAAGNSRGRTRRWDGSLTIEVCCRFGRGRRTVGRSTVRKGDVVLLKGSRGVKLEQAINTVKAQFASMEP